MDESSDPEAIDAEIVDLRNQVAALTEQVSEQRSGRRRRIRSVVSWVLLVVSTVLVVLTASAWWVHSTLLDTDRFMAVVEPAISSDAFEDQLSLRLTEATTDALDLETRFEARLSAIDQYLATGLVEALGLDDRALDIVGRLDLPRFADLAGPIATALDQSIGEAIDGLIRSDEFGAAVVTTIRRAHGAAVTLATDDLEALENVYVDEDGLVIDLLPLVGDALRTVIEDDLLGGEEIQAPDLSDRPRLDEALDRIAAAVGERVPDDLGQVTVLDREQYDTLRAAARLLDRLVWAITALAIVSIMATIWVAPGRRRMVVRLSVAVLLAMWLAVVLIERLVDAVQGGISDAGVVATIDAFLSAINGSLTEVLSVVFWLAVGIGLVSYLLGRPPWLVNLLGPLGDRTLTATDLDRTIARHTELLAAVGAAVVLAVAWATGLAFWWTTAALVAYGIGLWWVYGARGRVRAEDRMGTDADPVGSLGAGSDD